MKIGILTLYYKNYNYGGMLQAYALVKYINNLGIDCEQISFDRGAEMLQVSKPRREDCSNSLSWCVKSLKSWVKRSIIQQNFDEKVCKAISGFDSFMNDIPHSAVCDRNNISECSKEYSGIIVGSDQVWNPSYCGEEYYLNFYEGKKSSYAASIGNYALVDKEKLGKAIDSFDYISVREKTDKEFLGSFSDKSVESVLDPTMLLETEDWRKVEKPVKCKSLNRPYVFVYLIGNHKRNREIVKNLTKQGFFTVCIPRHYEDTKCTNLSIYDAGPAEFLSLIENAEYVITDSFHASVFSIHFEKKFSALKRDKMNQRLEDLFSGLGVADVWAECEEDVLKGMNRSRDYKAVKETLESERVKSKQYLSKVLSAH